MSSTLRASLATSHLSIVPGQPVRVSVEVTNASGVIDGVVASIGPAARAFDGALGHEVTGLSVRSEPALLPLFPDGTGVITLDLRVSPTYRAGLHDLEVRLASTVQPDDAVDLPLVLEVAPTPAATLSPTPLVRSGRSRVAYSIACQNLGNTALELTLGATDPERAARIRFTPAAIALEPGQAATADLRVRARRRLLGGEVSRKVTVVGTAPDLEVDTQVTFRQRPVIPRGMRTVLVLAAITALWAAVVVVALHKALATDPIGKDAPASYYAASQAKESSPKSSGASATGPGGRRLDLQNADADGPAPAGAVPKTGVVVGVGGTINGTVTAASTGSGIGRISVEAYGATPSGEGLVASAASQTDGSYTIAGLLPGPYRLLFTATGYRDVWYPDATSQTAAHPVTVNAMGKTNGVDVTINGADATITGTVETGQTPSPPVTVTVDPAQGSTTSIATVQSNAQGEYTVGDLPAPGTYDLSFSSAGYQVGTDTEVVSGGEQHIDNTVTLSAGPGSIAGTVTGGTGPLGGVTITAAANGQTVTSATPTTGAVGQFNLANLPTPATYLLTFSASGYGTQTLAEHLNPGQNVTGLSVTMAGGAGEVTGLVSSGSGGPLGGVTVTVTGGSKPVTTQTLTAGTVGSYDIEGLTTPGAYTVTFSLAGYTSQTVAVSLTSNGSASGIDATLPTSTGTITGSVTDSTTGAALTGVKVSVTSGGATQTTTTSTAPPGGYSLGGLAPDTYSVTFTMADYDPVTALVSVTAGQTSTQPIQLTPTG